MAKVNLDLRSVEASGGGGDDLLPAGTYAGRVVGTSLHDTRTGNALKVIFNVTEGECEGMQFSDFLNIVNESTDTQKWALSKLKKIMELGGHPNPGALADSDELVGLTMSVKLAQEPNYKDPTYTDNKVKGYSAATITEHKSVGAMATKPVGITVSSNLPQTPSASRAKLPWE